VRNINVNYFALSELADRCVRLPGATRLTLFGACPWLSYCAPSALPGFHIPRLRRRQAFDIARLRCWRGHSALTRGDAPHVVRRLPLAFILRAFGAARLSYSASSALLGFHIPRLRRC